MMVDSLALRRRRFLRLAVVLALTYFVSWFAVYVVVVGFDLGFVLEYFRLSWTGGGELPTFIQLGALLVTGVVGMAAALRTYARTRSKH